MTGSRITQPAPDLPTGPRAALVIGIASYSDPELGKLRAPAHDAESLAKVLGDPGIGGFSVTQVLDQDERQVRRSIDAFLSGRATDDVVVLYLSCHGVLDRRGRLYFAAADTMKAQLGSTGIPSSWLLDQLEECRARRQVLILDCCFSGAFEHGRKGDLDLEERLAGQGRGRAVLTASRAGEYSFEGQALRGAAVAGSVFTAGLVEGLRTGAADTDGDGYVTLDEAYDYAYGYVQSKEASQTPQRWLYASEGKIVLARNPAGVVITAAPLPEALASSLKSPYPDIRIGAARALGEWLSGTDRGQVLTAERILREIAATDIPEVAAAARAAWSPTRPGVDLQESGAGDKVDGNLTGVRNTRLYWQGWLPDGAVTGVLLLCHGAGEHSGRYQNVIDTLSPDGWAVYGLDHRGHGRSSGEPVHVQRFSDWIDDFEIFWRKVVPRHPDMPVFILGHSLGAQIALDYALRHQDALRGLVLSAAFLATASVPQVVRPVAKFASRLLPRTRIKLVDLNKISKDPEVVQRYRDDLLVYQGNATLAMANIVESQFRVLIERSRDLAVPVLIQYGMKDAVADPAGSERLYQAYGSADKTILPYPGLWHEIYNEPEREGPLRDLRDWLASHR